MSNGAPQQRQAADDQNRAHRDIARWTRWVAFFTFVLAAATIVSSYFIWGQWNAAEEAQTDTRQQLRAYVTFVGGVQILNEDPSGKTVNYFFRPRFHNWGATRTGRFGG
jgi:hypothetical protein